MIGEANETEIFVCGKKVSALIDTGAMVSSMSEDFYNTIEPKPVLHQLTEFQLDVFAADGQKLPYIGYIEAEVCAPYLANSDNTILSLILITQATEYRQRVPVIIGTNIIRLFSSMKEISDTIYQLFLMNN